MVINRYDRQYTAELTARLEELGEKVDPDDLADAVDQAREETAKSVFEQ
jgi:hypothetical protein